MICTLPTFGMLPEEYRHLSREEMEQRVYEIKKQLGKELFIPAHHYQKDEIIQFADAIGDSLQLAQAAAKNKEAKHIVFCGVHFMAETADMLTTEEQIVYLPDLRAGCSMADMANIYQTEEAWEKLTSIFGDTILPLTYVNSTAAIKAFTGRNGGACVTSSNAKKMVEWAFTQKERIFFLPDQHLGRNCAYELGIPLEQMAVWDPISGDLSYEGDLQNIKVILWDGYCSVHQGFTVENVQEVRKKYPDMTVIVHPECAFEVVQAADLSGSTKFIVDTIQKAPAGSSWAIGTEMNLVKRIIAEHKDKYIICLNDNMCPCLTMNRIDLPHLLWALDIIIKGEQGNVIKVDESTTKEALLALDRMLQLA
ncbi:quinolinate synthase NadA [Ureibacillus thermophilus]|uniref:Quinolinate synthase n=1 Tax=Ureibacillus thermophilus TaxID=367743 RepID=A0A4P6UXN4_9BACL|nr:quinolinate synthase NadA [Ureibacillus thermophilus]QBK26482.1 quinolinate synthase NadA [Ureibacillus thermophilus]